MTADPIKEGCPCKSSTRRHLARTKAPAAPLDGWATSDAGRETGTFTSLSPKW